MSPADLIRPGAWWEPAAWTPARCALYREMDDDGKARLFRWVDAEKTRGRCHATQLPNIEDRAAA